MIIDPPSYAASVSEWKRYIEALRKLPDDDDTRAAIKEAETHIAWLERDAKG